MHQRVKSHFKKADPRLFKVLQSIGDVGKVSSIPPRQYFSRLCREIIAQQLSGKVADTFMERFRALFPKKSVSPKRVLGLSDGTLRKIGISWAKVKYLKDLAQKVQKEEVSLENLQYLDDKTVIAQLTKVKGIGDWTAEMFLMFSLGREDVFSCGDLGLQKAIEEIYQIKNLTKSKAEKLSMRWSPYRTYASLILWRSRDRA
ncbi:MAG: DNA-3-methyladenine glycosylase [Parcubacteria group bacterium Greene0714_21]|nr:MAG: DNA-3-methyladenine glycosylase [Parcubacteria group bacterium Greene0416_39]TSC97519.1 MAG: DNA-3-methyladenine glycosylase [Parcubacteria group bacterium Greene1014_47]TSD04396.1 MAG: DNA-3-methyladenine glycosylase [Parcubacteria group bacterium Greene0714_21]